MRLNVKDLSFRYADRTILNNISFSAGKNDFLCVLGPNGVGKSTLFKCMLGLLKGYSGDIFLGNENIKSISRREMAKKIAYIPQSNFPTFNFSVLNTVLMGTTAQLGVASSPKIEQENLVMDTLEKLGIKHLADRGYGEISGGERQLVLIARAMVQSAKVIVMDEPTANLDYGNQIKVMRYVKQLSDDGYTIILSTHNPEHAFLYANKIMVVYKGEVIKFGSPESELDKNTLEKIYGVGIDLYNINSYKKDIKVCIPANI